MQTSIFLAKLLGPILLIAGIAMLVNRKELDALAHELLRSSLLLFLLGLIDFSIGLANCDRDKMRRTHHHAFDNRLTANAGELP